METSLFGIIGYSFAAIGFFSSKDQKTKVFLVLACLCNGLYFALNELYISAAIVGITGLRIGVSIYLRNTLIGVLFLITTIAIPLLVESSDWMAVIPGVTGTIAAYWMTGRSMKIMLIVGSLLWILNNAISGAWIGVIGESILVVSGVLGLIRMSRKTETFISREIPA